MNQLVIPLDESDLTLLPYYAETIGVDLSQYQTVEEQVNALATTLKAHYRLRAINLKAEQEATAAADAVRAQYE